jgi:IS30 family transposase
MTYKHLSQTERYQIFSLMKEGLNCTEIAKNLGRSKSTISREIVRNKGGRGYRPRQTDQLARERSLLSRNARRIEPDVLKAAFDRISEQLSPEQVAAELPISHETLYQHIYADKAAGGALWKNLRCQKKKKKRYASGVERRGQIANRRPISERPADVEIRRTVGHWEGDTVIGAGHKQAIVTLVERKSGYARLMKVSHKTSKQVADAVIKKLRSVHARVKTITFDNGKEFAEHARIDKALGSTTYFADPFSSWQRGSNENLNGLLRQYIPKKRPLSTVTDEELRMIEHRLNNRPRKRLGFKTPNQVFHESLNRVALHT